MSQILGFVKLPHFGTTAPANKKQLWVKTSTNDENTWDILDVQAWQNSTGTWESVLPGSGGGGGSTAFDGNRIITRAGDLQGITPGGTDVVAFLNNLLYPSEPPTASLTLTLDGTTNGSNRTKEFDAGTIESATANWTAGRQATSDSLQSIEVDGNIQSFTNPAQGASVNGTQVLSFPSNVDKSIELVVTTADGKSDTDSIAVNYRWKLYLGFATTNTPPEGDIHELFNRFGNNPDYSGSIAHPDGSTQMYFLIVFPLSQEPAGGVTIKLGGFDITPDFSRSVRPFSNASGGSADHVMLVSKNTTVGDYNDIQIIS